MLASASETLIVAALHSLHGKKEDRHGARVHILHDGQGITGVGVADISCSN